MLNSTQLNANVIENWSSVEGRTEQGATSLWRCKLFTACPITPHTPQKLPRGRRNLLQFFPAFLSLICHPIKYSLVPRFASQLVLGFALMLHEPCYEKQMERDCWFLIVYLGMKRISNLFT